MALVDRRVEHVVRLALNDTRVVAVVGARQAGKSTLVRQIVRTLDNARERRLDRPSELAAARDDPEGFVRHDGLLVLDEVQRAPELLLAVKAVVDEDTRPGRYLLTGSARLLGLRLLPDALVGRTETIELWPFSQGEIQGTPDSFLADILADDDPAETLRSIDGSRRNGSPLVATSIIERVVRGGFPEAVARDEPRRRRFLASYLGDLVDRDVTQLSDISRRDQLHRLLRGLSSRTSQPLAVNGLASELGLPATTVERYVSLLEEVFLVKRIPAFRPGGTGRTTHQRKLLFVDSGIAAYLRGHGTARLSKDRALLGPLVENMVLGELARQIGWSDEPMTLGHYRTRDGIEVDCVVEHADGRFLAVEVKTAESVRHEDFKHLRHLQERVPDRFHLGVVFHLGRSVASFGPRLWALPANLVWEGVGGS